VESGAGAEGGLIRVHEIAAPCRSPLNVIYAIMKKGDLGNFRRALQKKAEADLEFWSESTEEEENLRSSRRKDLMPLRLREHG